MKRISLAIAVGAGLAFSPWARAVPVTFQVDLSVQQALGKFTPGSDTVIAAGAFDGWSTDTLVLSPSAGNANIYTGSYDVTNSVGSSVEYKFIVNSGGTLNWESRANRAFTLASSAQTLPVAFFNDVTTAAAGGQITFSVNLKVQQGLGNFHPDTDTIICAGTFDNWSTSGLVLAQSTTDTNVYTGVYNDANESPGATVQYKFIINSPGAALNWEGIPNRSFVLPTVNTNLPTVFFNNLTNNPGTGVPVTFQVNVAVMAAEGRFSTDSGTVNVAGTFNNWSTTAGPLTNSAANPTIYKGTFNDLSDAPGNIGQYKFILNGGNWESINNRNFTLAATSQTLPIVFYNDMNDLGKVSVTDLSNGQLTLSWIGGLPTIRLQSSANLKTWLDVDGSAGANTITVPANPTQQFFRLTAP